MIAQTPAIVLKSFPYGETSIIARCFSRNYGKISLIVKGARTKKKSRASFFEPLSHIDLVYHHKSNAHHATRFKTEQVRTTKNVNLAAARLTFQ